MPELNTNRTQCPVPTGLPSSEANEQLTRDTGRWGRWSARFHDSGTAMYNTLVSAPARWLDRTKRYLSGYSTMT